MKYEVTARWWNEALIKRFGDDKYCIHELSDSEVISCIMEFGRAEITKPYANTDLRQIDFHNDYD